MTKRGTICYFSSFSPDIFFKDERLIKLRVIGGRLKRKKLASFSGKHIRPTSDRVKEAVFNIISSRIEKGPNVLDLFAGTGNLGIEALSRGAGRVIFVEKDKSSVEIIRKNLQNCGITGEADIIEMDVKKAIALIERKRAGKKDGHFDLIFLDPPYDQGLADGTLQLLGESPLTSGALIIAEHSLNEEVREHYGSIKMVDSRKYGDTSVSFFSGACD